MNSAARAAEVIETIECIARDASGRFFPLPVLALVHLSDDLTSALEIVRMEEEVHLVVGAILTVDLCAKENTRASADRVGVPLRLDDPRYDIALDVHRVPPLEVEVARSDLERITDIIRDHPRSFLDREAAP